MPIALSLRRLQHPALPPDIHLGDSSRKVIPPSADSEQPVPSMTGKQTFSSLRTCLHRFVMKGNIMFRLRRITLASGQVRLSSLQGFFSHPPFGPRTSLRLTVRSEDLTQSFRTAQGPHSVTPLCHFHSACRSLGQARASERFRQMIPKLLWESFPRTPGIFGVPFMGGFPASAWENQCRRAFPARPRCGTQIPLRLSDQAAIATEL